MVAVLVLHRTATHRKDRVLPGTTHLSHLALMSAARLTEDPEPLVWKIDNTIPVCYNLITQRLVRCLPGEMRRRRGGVGGGGRKS